MDEKPVSIDKWFAKKITISVGMVLLILLVLSVSFFLIKSTVNQRASYRNEADTTGLEIGSLIRMVKTELMMADSQRINNNESALFALKDFEMEISFIVRSTNRHGGNIGYQFVTVESGSETGNEKIQKLTLHWDAIPATMDTIWAEDDSTEIAIENEQPKKNSP